MHATERLEQRWLYFYRVVRRGEHMTLLRKKGIKLDVTVRLFVYTGACPLHDLPHRD